MLLLNCTASLNLTRITGITSSDKENADSDEDSESLRPIRRQHPCFQPDIYEVYPLRGSTSLVRCGIDTQNVHLP